MTTVEFFWDVGSPYSYLAWTQLEGLKARTGVAIVLRPFLLGAVFKATGNTAPALVPAKAHYGREDLRRWRDHYAVPMRLPGEAPFPLNTILPMRAATVALVNGHGDAFCQALFHRYWAEGHDVSEPDEVAHVAAGLGLDGAAMLEQAKSQAIKDALRATTDDAVSRGAFGAPAMFLGESLYFGNDRLGLLEARLETLKKNKPAP